MSTDKRRCAFLTLADRADFCIYDHLLFEPLGELAWQVEEIPWDTPDHDWAQYEAVIIRSTWDYQNHLDQFMATLEHIESVTRLLNPLQVCRWNSNKTYLRELSARGVTIVPTRFLKGLTVDALDDAFAHFAQRQLVAKPAVGANADDTFVLKADMPHSWGEAIYTFQARELLVQPFLDAILREGEYSLFYFDRAFSHAILKQPADGDFRVQEEHGGLIRLYEPTPELLEAGNRCMAAIDGELLYGRVDLVRIDSGELAVIEVELIEPSLYFDQDAGAASRFASAFQRMLPALDN